jgi:DNA-binding transcriptional LysR family regulator
VRDGGLVARKFATDRTVLCASPAYLGRRGTPTTAQDLVHHDCLIYSLLKVADEWRFRDSPRREPVSLAVEGRFCASSGAVLRRAALAGMGLAVLPTFMVAADLAAGRLRTVVNSFAGAELTLFAVYPHVPQSSRPPAKVRAFVDTLMAAFRQPAWKQS